MHLGKHLGSACSMLRSTCLLMAHALLPEFGADAAGVGRSR
jgi:hypothetical protein